MMTIWIDGDACPKNIKQVLFRAANRTRITTLIVSNHPLNIPPSPFVKSIQVGAGFDMVDHYIVDHLKAGDLVITADLPFASDVIDKGGQALNPRGILYTINNIKPLLAQRNSNEVLRGSGLMEGGPGALNARDIQRFSNLLDQWLQKAILANQ